MKYFGGCDVGSTYTKAVIMDENGKVLADTTIKSKIKTNRPEPACTIAVPGFGPVCLLVTTHSMRQSSQGTLHAAKS